MQTIKLLPFGLLLSKTWQSYRAHWKIVVPYFLIPLALSVISESFIAGVFVSIFLVLGSTAFILFLKTDGRHDGGMWLTYRRGFNYFFSYLWIVALVILCIWGGLIFFVLPGIYLSAIVFFSVFVLVTENKNGFLALSRSCDLVRGHWWGVFWRLWLIFAIGSMIGLVTFYPVVGKLVDYLFLQPILLIFFYELFRNLKEIHGDAGVDIREDSSCGKIKFFTGIGVVVLVLLTAIRLLILSPVLLDNEQTNSLRSAVGIKYSLDKYVIGTFSEIFFGGNTESKHNASSTADVSSQVDGSYFNSKYGFGFKYPPRVSGGFQEYPDYGMKECWDVYTNIGTTTAKAVTVVDIDDIKLSVRVVCYPLTNLMVLGGDGIVDEYSQNNRKDSVIKLNDITINTYEFTTATGYHVRAAVIPFGEKHLQVVSNFGNIDRMSGRIEMSDTEWSNLLKSFVLSESVLAGVRTGWKKYESREYGTRFEYPSELKMNQTGLPGAFLSVILKKPESYLMTFAFGQHAGKTAQEVAEYEKNILQKYKEYKDRKIISTRDMKIGGRPAVEIVEYMPPYGTVTMSYVDTDYGVLDIRLMPSLVIEPENGNVASQVISEKDSLLYYQILSTVSFFK